MYVEYMSTYKKFEEKKSRYIQEIWKKLNTKQSFYHQLTEVNCIKLNIVEKNKKILNNIISYTYIHYNINYV